MPFPDAFATRRLRAERLRPEHYADLLRMHQDPVQMELLGGVRDEAQTREYLEKNLAHWDVYGFGAWILRDAATGQVVGRAILRHLALGAEDEVEVGYSLGHARRDPDLRGRGADRQLVRRGRTARRGRVTRGPARRARPPAARPASRAWGGTADRRPWGRSRAPLRR